MSSLRQRRLASDFEALSRLADESAGRLVIQSTTGVPPESYRLVFHCRGVVRLDADEPVFGNEHFARVYLPAAYPAASPVITWLTPVVHPHIWPNRTACLGAWRSQEKLDSVVLRAAAMLTFDPAAINWRSVADDEAAAWARHYKQRLPVDAPFVLAASEPEALHFA